ncbi:hypothetical protein [Nostoc sp.]|uniref:hypothetical protein n=1 Tax=Nostoc sp. TaxID=1180 RepID=UPI002FF55D3C
MNESLRWMNESLSLMHQVPSLPYIPQPSESPSKTVSSSGNMFIMAALILAIDEQTIG